MVYTGPGSASCKILGGRLPPITGSFSKLGEEGDFFSQKIIVRTCGETHSIIDSMLAYMAQYALQEKMIFLIYHITITYWAAQNATQNLCKKSLDKLYFTLEK